jgi:7-cyano-7-deazaguanine synthase
MDSVAMAHMYRGDGEKLRLLSFDYGQRHGSQELRKAELCGRVLEVPQDTITMPTDFVRLLSQSSSSLVNNNVDVPDGHYAEESMKATVVPNRNMMMLSIAASVAMSTGMDSVATAVHSGDHAIYPDCRPQFIEDMNKVLGSATEGFWWDHAVRNFVRAPFLNISKDEIVRIGEQYDVDWEDTWSCYKGDDVHCGRCGTCVERKEAFRLAEVADPTQYEDEEFEVEAYRG